MPYGDVDICNIALTRVGAPPIGSLSENTEPARVLNRIFAVIRDSVVQDADWNFARKEGLLTETENPSVLWDYAYIFPANALAFRGILNEYGQQVSPPIAYDVMTSVDESSRVIVTNHYQARGVWTRQITNAGLFTPLFIDAFASRLAAELACTLLINKTVHETELGKYAAFIAKANNTSASEEASELYTYNPIIQARN